MGAGLASGLPCALDFESVKLPVHLSGTSCRENVSSYLLSGDLRFDSVERVEAAPSAKDGRPVLGSEGQAQRGCTLRVDRSAPPDGRGPTLRRRQSGSAAASPAHI